MREIRWSPYLGMATAAERTALSVPNSACSIFVYPNEGCGCQCLGSLTCAQMLMHAIAHEGCTDSVRESALKVDSARKTKIPCRTGESNVPHRRAGSTLYQLSYIPLFLFLQRRPALLRGLWTGCSAKLVRALRYVHVRRF